jgi:hypothetical protein
MTPWPPVGAQKGVAGVGVAVGASIRDPRVPTGGAALDTPR